MLVKIHETLAVNPELVSEIITCPDCIQVVMADGTQHNLPFGDTETDVESFNRVVEALYGGAGAQANLDQLREELWEVIGKLIKTLDK